MRHFLTVAFFILSCSSFGQIRYENNLESAIQRAKSENRILLIKYYSKDCSHCRQLQQVLDTDSVSEVFNRQFVNFPIDSETGVSAEISFLQGRHRIYPERVPYLLFFDPEGGFIHFAQPRQEAGALLKVAEQALKPEERTSNLEPAMNGALMC